MPEYVINRLHFLSNDKTILAHIKSRDPGNESPVQFSLNSIQPTPAGLILPLHPEIVALSALNIDIPVMDQRTTRAVLDHVFFGRTGKAPLSDIHEKIEAARSVLQQAAANGDAAATPERLTSFERAVTNYRQYQFFSQYDWRMTTWGTIADIHDVDAATFERPTRCIAFETVWTPPIAALQLLSNAFPSVRFTLRYHYADDSWHEVEFFPFPPFGY